MSQQIDRDTGLTVPQIKVKFGTAGIRGVYGEEVSVKETIAVCYAVHMLLGTGRFGIGYDTRKTSLLLANVASAAMNWYGSDVEDYGMIPTPVLAFNIKSSKLHAGFSVTASHNPPEYAGVKVFGTDGIEFSLEAEKKIEQLVQKSESYTKEGELGAFGSSYQNEEAASSYITSLLERFDASRKLKILVDCANGTAGGITPRVLGELGHHVVTVNAHPSGSFPGRLPEPMFETLGEVASLTRSIGADFAIAHDGDADRLVMIDELGNVVPDYALSALVLRIIAEKVKRGNVIISVNSSSAVEETAVKLGCKVQRSRLGKTFEELYKRKGIFACEPSKMVDPRWGYWEDGIYTGVLVAQYLSENSRTLSSVVAGIPVYHNLQRNLQSKSFLNYDQVKVSLQSVLADRIDRFDELDGVKAYLKGGGWLMIRSSGTESKVRVYVESPDESEAVFLLEDGVRIAKSCSK